MRFTSEEGEEIREITARQLRKVLAEEAFGKFAVLEANLEDFIQAGCDWQPGEETRRFLAEHDSDPWLLEARGGGAQFRVTRHVTLREVIAAFTSYLRRGTEWQQDFQWALIQGSVRAGAPAPTERAKKQSPTKHPVVKKPGAKKPGAKKPVAKKPVAKNAVAEKGVATKALRRAALG